MQIFFFFNAEFILLLIICFSMSARPLFILSVLCDLQRLSKLGTFILLMNSRAGSENNVSYLGRKGLC